MYWKSNQYLKEEYPFFPRNLESIRGSEELKSLAEKSLVRGSFLINKFKNFSVKKPLNIIFSIKQFKIYRLFLYSSHFFLLSVPFYSQLLFFLKYLPLDINELQMPFDGLWKLFP